MGMITKIKEKIHDYFPDFHWNTLTNLGIGKTMLLWFLAISLIPLGTLSFINYIYYYQGLNILSKKSLFTTSQLRVNNLNDYFTQADDYLTFLCRDKDHIRLFQEIDQQAEHEDHHMEAFLSGQEYEGLNRELNASFKKSWALEGLYNILLIDEAGNIVYTIKNKEILGSNLLTGSLSTTLAGETFATVNTSGKRRFSDLERFPPENPVATMMMMETVYAPSGKKLGVLAIQITTKRIDDILQYNVGFGSTARVYLIGLDLKLRSISEYGKNDSILYACEDNEKTRSWQVSKLNKTSSTPGGEPIVEGVTYYANTQQKDVMGLYRQVSSLENFGVEWILVEEIENEEAHAVARELSTFAKISLVVTTIFVFIISLFVTRRFVTPIKKISAWAKQVAQGELISKDIKVSNDEVGEMKKTFNRLVSSLQQYAQVSQSIALGDYSQKVPIRSKEDILGQSMNEMVESFKGVVKQAKAIASGDYSTNVIPRSDQDTLGISLFNMTKKLREASTEIRNQDWLKTGLNELSLEVSGEQGISELADKVLSFLARYLDAQVGLLYVKEKNQLKMAASYACKPEITKFELGEGLIGQVAREKKPLIFSKPQENLSKINLGSHVETPTHYIISPIMFEGTLLGVFELGSFKPFNDVKHLFIENSLENIALAINTAKSRERVEELLKKTQEQANELQEQKEELRQINEELEEQTKALRHSEENLQHQQEELRVINEELEERTKVLELQRDDIRKKNQALQQAQNEIKQKAEALEVASKYKSEFLTNMSHELRTPLNSILALSEILASNKYKGLTKDEIEFAKVINSSGKDLLELINDILDLSKVEAGKMEVDIEDLYLEDLEDYVKKTFTPLTDKKGIKLKTKLAKGLPERIETDPQRALQIIKNLLSNAIKFTDKGSVTFSIHRPEHEVRFTNPDLTHSNCLAFEVADTGIGISQEKVNLIFEAFQQADGTVSRKFGGTGLGLTISRSLSQLLGGEIHLSSEENEGSTFILYLPDQANYIPGDLTPPSNNKPVENKEEAPRREPLAATEGEIRVADSMDEDQEKTSEEIEHDKKADEIFHNKKILIVDDDMRNVFVLTNILEEKKLQIIVGKNGIDGIEKLNANPDTDLVLMDIMMPEMDGYEAMQEIRKDGRFDNLPIIALTAKAMKGDREKCIQAGANEYLSKPVQTNKLLSMIRVWLQK